MENKNIEVKAEEMEAVQDTAAEMGIRDRSLRAGLFRAYPKKTETALWRPLPGYMKIWKSRELIMPDRTGTKQA